MKRSGLVYQANIMKRVYLAASCDRVTRLSAGASMA